MVGVGDERRRGGVQTRGVRRGGAADAAATHTPATASAQRPARGVPFTSSARARDASRRARRRHRRRRARRRRTRQSPRRVTHPLRATPHGRRYAPTGIVVEMATTRVSRERGGEFWMRANRAVSPARAFEPRPRPAGGPVTRVAPRGGVHVANVHSFSNGAPTPAPNTGDASPSLAYTRNAGARYARSASPKRAGSVRR